MAKGLRASTKVKARNARRYTPGSDYQVTHAARLNAISSRLLSRIQSKSSAKAKDSDKAAEQTEDDAVDETESLHAAAMETDGATDTAAAESNASSVPSKKISTSGTRESRRETWRKARGWKPKNGSKNGGKPKRRR